MLSVSLYFWRIVKKGFKPTGRQFLAALAMTIITFVFIHYGEYKITYVDNNNEINHHLNGEHISNYVDQDDNVFSFTHYVVYKLENSNSSIGYRGREISKIDTSTGYNLFGMIIDFVGFLLGGICTGLISTSGKTHCTACKRAYVKEHHLGELKT
ncbi:hypothetical protein [Cohnella sp.]|uniref:hypothetical protein n=1 Tax=Cohnella sp. TaxID=1883426 RepID=UPI00356B4CA1